MNSLIAEGRRLIGEATKGSLHVDDDDDWAVRDRDDVLVAVHERFVDAPLHVLAVNVLPTLLDVAEAGERLLAFHDNCGMDSTHGDALRAALAKLKEVG